MPPASVPSPFLFIFMGAASLLLQIAVLRLLLATFSGNELTIGITLSFWLLYVGIGSALGKRFSRADAFCYSFIVSALFAVPTALAIKLCRSSSWLTPGEATSLAATIIATAVILAPICLILGVQFPLAVSYAGSRNPAGRVYGLESLGACCGGILFTFALASRIDSLELCIVVSLCNVIAATYLGKRKALLSLGFVPLILFFAFRAQVPSVPMRGGATVLSQESKIGEITVVSQGTQSNVYINGQFAYSHPDPQTEERGIHVPMTMHPSPDSLLVIGGSPGCLREILKYTVSCVDFIELDPKLAALSEKLIDAAEGPQFLKDPRVRIVIQDGRRFVKSAAKDAYDMVIVNLPQPTTASINRFYTRDFFREAKSVLRKDGIISIKLLSSSGYMGRSMQIANGSVFNALASVFPNVAVTSQEYGFLFASDAPMVTDAHVLEARFLTRSIPVTYFPSSLFRDAFSSFGVHYVRDRLRLTVPVNTDARPSAYLYNLVLWTEVHGGMWLGHLMRARAWVIVGGIVLFFSLMAFVLFRKKEKTVPFTIFTTGFASLSLSLIAILVFQSLHGYIYEMIGLLAALFMAGVWVGASAARTFHKPFTPLILLDTGLFFLAVASSLLLREPLMPFFVALFAGILCGAQFSAASFTVGSSVAGLLYALDLSGSFIGALITSIAIVPLYGVQAAALIVALIKLASAILLLAFRTFPHNSFYNGVWRR